MSMFSEPCCALKYYPEIEICVKEQKGEQEAKRKEAQRLEDENFGNHYLGRARTFLWNLMEYPETSKYAQVSVKAGRLEKKSTPRIFATCGGALLLSGFSQIKGKGNTLLAFLQTDFDRSLAGINIVGPRLVEQQAISVLFEKQFVLWQNKFVSFFFA